MGIDSYTLGSVFVSRSQYAYQVIVYVNNTPLLAKVGVNAFGVDSWRKTISEVEQIDGPLQLVWTPEA